MELKTELSAIEEQRQSSPGRVARAACRQGSSEDGYTLLIAIFFLALLTLSLSIAVPQVTKQIQRDREFEAMQRGKQYIRGVQLYYRKFRKYPPSIDALEDTNGVRFLRKRYVDPITGKDDWRPILFGQNKIPTNIAFFGMTKASMAIAPIASTDNGITGNGFGQQTQNSPAGTNGSSAAGNTSASSDPASGPSLGGAVIGVTLPSEKRSILVYKRQDKYDLWEFAYDPSIDPLSSIQVGAIGGGAQGAIGGTSPTNTNGAPPQNPVGSPPPTNTVPPPAFTPID
jgi:type II secretory pathway pseudopilin PulG